MNTTKLPENYILKRNVNLKNDKKTFIIVNVLSLVIAIIMAIVPIILLINKKADFFFADFNQFLVLIVSMIAYIIMHELTHGLVLKAFLKVKLQFGLSLTYAYCGSKEAYLDKKSYIVVALAPLVLWGVVFLVLNILLPEYFLLIYIMQIINVSGAAGDIYIAILTAKMPKDVLCNDTGTEMNFYEKAQ